VARPLRTDLALEAHEALPDRKLPGVDVEEERPAEGVLVTRVHVRTEAAGQALGKPPGHYVTVESRGLRKHDREHAMTVGKVLSTEMERMLAAVRPQTVLVVGLGNWNATPDALGPKVVGKVLVTRHLQGMIPPDLEGHLRSVAAVAPGVLGLTGVETSEIVRGMVERVEPDLVVAIDALAAAKVERILTTIQLADTGIHPGSGVGNHRSGLTSDRLGCPVFALGVPTVVHATTIAFDAMDALWERLAAQGEVATREDRDREELFHEVVRPALAELMVTPKEIDVQIEDLARLIAGAINTCLHPGVDLGEFALYT
jgi:spore protease